MQVVPRVVLTLLLFTLGFQSCFSQSKGVGDALLDDYMKAIAVSNARDASARKMRAALDQLDAKIQAVQSEVPEEFFLRYRRLISVTRAVIGDKQDESSRAKTLDFIKSIIGTVPTEREMISAAAQACTTEVSRLRTLLHK